MKVQFASQGWEDYRIWQQDRQMLRRVNALIEDIRRNGQRGGVVGLPVDDGAFATAADIFVGRRVQVR